MFTKQVSLLLLGVQSGGVETGVDVREAVEGPKDDHEVTRSRKTFLKIRIRNSSQSETQTRILSM